MLSSLAAKVEEKQALERNMFPGSPGGIFCCWVSVSLCVVGLVDGLQKPLLHFLEACQCPYPGSCGVLDMSRPPQQGFQDSSLYSVQPTSLGQALASRATKCCGILPRP